MYYFYTYNFSNFCFLHNDFYGNFPYKKRIPLNISLFEELLTPQALAIWIKDDGGTQKYGLTIETHSFTEKEVDYLCELLFRKFNLKCSKNKFGTINQFRIRIKEESLRDLAKLIKPYKHISMYYKLRKYFN